MPERLSAADAAVLSAERRTTPQHVGGLAILERPAGGFGYDDLVGLLEERIALAPRYRQKVRAVPAHLANPVWVDDPGFDISYHVRRSVLPRPGSLDQLVEFCARIQARLLDRSRPLWEMYLVEGLADGRVAIITKTHQAMVDGLGAIDLAQVILDETAEPHRSPEPLWMPEPEPSSMHLVVDALNEAAHRPALALEVAWAGVNDVRASVGRAVSMVTGTVQAAAAVLRAEQLSPLTAEPGEQRCLALARTNLADYRQVRAGAGGTVNDVVLATVAGALRGWLLFRGEPVRASGSVRALVPVIVDELDGPRVTGLLVDLPVGEPDPLVRLARITFALSSHKASGQSVGADTLVALGGFAPPTLHALGVRAAASLRRRLFSLVVTNVPGPQVPLYAAGARMQEMFPIVPLGPGEAVSIGLTSYDGGVFYGINGDGDLAGDVAVLATLVEESLAELVEASQAAGSSMSPRLVGSSTRRRRAQGPAGCEPRG